MNTEHDDDKRTEPSSLDDAPASEGVEGDTAEFLRRCDTERDTMTPKETSDCAGVELAEAYENEEDGGS